MALAVLWAGLVNWLVTTILVESHLFAPIRNWIVHETWYITGADGKRHQIGGKHAYIWPEGTKEEDVPPPYMWGPWVRVAQLVTCQLCTRVWIGFAEAAYFGGPDHGPFRLVANGLLYAAVGHLIFEVRSRLALVAPVD